MTALLKIVVVKEKKSTRESTLVEAKRLTAESRANVFNNFSRGKENLNVKIAARYFLECQIIDRIDNLTKVEFVICTPQANFNFFLNFVLK